MFSVFGLHLSLLFVFFSVLEVDTSSIDWIAGCWIILIFCLKYFSNLPNFKLMKISNLCLMLYLLSMC
jgi:hypothetical protein